MLKKFIILAFSILLCILSLNFLEDKNKNETLLSKQEKEKLRKEIDLLIKEGDKAQKELETLIEKYSD